MEIQSKQEEFTTMPVSVLFGMLVSLIKLKVSLVKGAVDIDPEDDEPLPTKAKSSTGAVLETVSDLERTIREKVNGITTKNAGTTSDSNCDRNRGSG